MEVRPKVQERLLEIRFQTDRFSYRKRASIPAVFESRSVSFGLGT